MRWLEHRVPPPLLALLLGWAMHASAAGSPALPWPRAVAWPLMALLVLAGLACDLSGLWRFLRARTTINPLRPQNSSALVTGGIYRLTRNPMYLGLALLLSAWAVHLQTAWPWAGPLAFVAYITRFQILPEERALRARFGSDYQAYCERVRRWL
ncbi:methyltransferase family protein [Ideonella oryzae]|uniref:Isoprenylcysteine carboxylmethyltransferase family protein n=1 Tax=Ideonella oryzae TaxID=2937441 RepID=A0ABT1BIF3_9BURK|nr:isoprenylcysteine carboxylmethyltransferase family protein [Ideonella oryzae]MCO5975848.1 isoprenylcysteine carboxylmethyltransferase family protein [Ideonella oryzae]